MRQLDLFGAFTEVTPEESKPSEKSVTPIDKVEDEAGKSEQQDAGEVFGINKLAEPEAIVETEEIHKAITEANESLDEVGKSIDELGQYAEEPSQILSVEVTRQTGETGIETWQEVTVAEILVAELETEVGVVEALSEHEEHIPIDPQVSEIKNGSPSRAKERKVSIDENGAFNRNSGSVIFDDGRISVKIKAKPAAVAVAAKEPEKIQKLPQKRGRKSFKEIDAEVDLIEIPDDEILNQKQYYSISQVAQWFKVNTSLIRFWENEFDIIKPKKNGKGDRLFRPEDVKNLQLIYHLLRERKYTIEGAKEFLKTNKKKADVELQLTQTLQKFKGFLLDLKANL
jgi:DNA-binding transcriptional MerR regulator